jgi:hypothetical protein
VYRARRHLRLLSLLAFGVLSLSAEVLGRSLTHRIDVGRHVATPSYAGAAYYPFLLAAVKVGVALLLARVCWRVVRARAAERAAERLLGRLGKRPRVRLTLSARLWALFFLLTALIYLVQTDAEQAASGRLPLLSPWLHSSALPVFAVLGVLCALAWAAARRWLNEYERYAQAAVARALSRHARADGRSALRPTTLLAPPRRLFGLAFESRPPPLPS